MSGLNVTIYAHVHDDTEITVESPEQRGPASVAWTINLGEDLVLFFGNRVDLVRLRDAITAALGDGAEATS